MHYRSIIALPKSYSDLSKTMSGFRKIAGLPYCAGAIDGSHVRWHNCPISQYYEYRCFKRYPSVVIFAVCDVTRRFLYADVCLPGVLSDGSLWGRSRLKSLIESGEWFGSDISSLIIDGVNVRPYLIGDCAFPLGKNMMNTTTKTQQKTDSDNLFWDRIASDIRKPIDCAFGILKNMFLVLNEGLKLHHEDDIAFCITSCIVLDNLSLQHKDDGDEFIASTLKNSSDNFTTDTTNDGKRIRETLLDYVASNSSE